MGDYTRKVGVDAIEVLNRGSSDEANRQARELAHSMQLPGVGGSDSHRPQDLFSIYNQVQAEPDLPQILAAISLGLVVPCVSDRSIRF
jgi:hypothetical protein